MASCHIRSISLSSRSHPLTVSIGQQLHKLKESQSSSISQKLGDLKCLYESLDDFLQLSLAQQFLSLEGQREYVENALTGYLRLLDSCSTTGDLYMQMKESVRELESALRRTRGRQVNAVSEVDAYLGSGKRLNKMTCKCLEDLKKKEKKYQTAPFEDNSSLEKVIGILRGVEEASLEVIESTLSFISHPKAKSKLSSRCVVSNFLHTKRVLSCEGEVHASEAEKINAELLVLKSSKDIKCLQIQSFLEGVKAFQSTLQEVEEELEWVYRLLVKTRVSLLNILNH